MEHVVESVSATTADLDSDVVSLVPAKSLSSSSSTMMDVVPSRPPAEDLFALANRESCQDALRLCSELPQVNSDSGWWIIRCLQINQIATKCDVNASTMIKVYERVLKYLDTYYVKAEAHVRKLCVEAGVPQEQWSTTDNPLVTCFRNKNIHAIKQDEYVTLEIPDNELCNLLFNLNSLFVAIGHCYIKFRKVSLRQDFIESKHAPMLMPFNRSPESMFCQLEIKPNENYKRLVSENLQSPSNIPYINVKGHVVVMVETVDSIGTNSANKKFKVSSLLEPSATMLTVYFNAYVRSLYPSLFADQRIAKIMFVKISESQSTQTISCMDPYRTKNAQLALVNLSGIFMLNVNGQVVPQLQMWVNLKLGA